MSNERRTTCATCGERLEQPDTGRPPKYCGEVCRRAAEYDLRRAQALLRRAEQRAQDARLALHLCSQWERKPLEKRLGFWDDEIDRLHITLRKFLAG